MPSLKQAQLRHIAFYEEILWQANALYLKGSTSTNESLVLFDQNWENIQLGHSYAALLADIDRTAAQFCSKYASSGAFILNLRQPPPERITWLENALYHARRLGNLGNAHRDIGEIEKRDSLLYPPHRILGHDLHQSKSSCSRGSALL